MNIGQRVTYSAEYLRAKFPGTQRTFNVIAFKDDFPGIFVGYSTRFEGELDIRHDQYDEYRNLINRKAIKVAMVQPTWAMSGWEGAETTFNKPKGTYKRYRDTGNQYRPPIAVPLDAVKTVED